MKNNEMTLPKKVELGQATHVKDVKRREGCEGDGKYFCNYLALFNDNENKIIALGTCYAHSGIDQYTQDSHPFYTTQDQRYPA